MGLSDLNYEPLDWMISAPSQGIIGVANLKSNTEIKSLLRKINCPQTEFCATIERTFLNTLEGGCTAPIGAFSYIENNIVKFKGGLFSLDGKEAIIQEDHVPLHQAKDLGIRTAKKILREGGRSLLNQIKSQM